MAENDQTPKEISKSQIFLKPIPVSIPKLISAVFRASSVPPMSGSLLHSYVSDSHQKLTVPKRQTDLVLEEGNYYIET